MKNKSFTHALVVALLASPALYAQDYPASNFQPKVIYSSEAPVTQLASTPCTPGKETQTEPDPKYPAASFQPKVIYNSADAK